MSILRVVLAGIGLCNRPIPLPRESCQVYVCVSFSVMRCNTNTLHLQHKCRKSLDKKGRKKVRSHNTRVKFNVTFDYSSLKNRSCRFVNVSELSRLLLKS